MIKGDMGVVPFFFDMVHKTKRYIFMPKTGVITKKYFY
jgi:hypothetical protein